MNECTDLGDEDCVDGETGMKGKYRRGGKTWKKQDAERG